MREIVDENHQRMIFENWEFSRIQHFYMWFFLNMFENFQVWRGITWCFPQSHTLFFIAHYSLGIIQFTNKRIELDTNFHINSHMSLSSHLKIKVYQQLWLWNFNIILVWKSWKSIEVVRSLVTSNTLNFVMD